MYWKLTQFTTEDPIFFKKNSTPWAPHEYINKCVNLVNDNCFEEKATWTRNIKCTVLYTHWLKTNLFRNYILQCNNHAIILSIYPISFLLPSWVYKHSSLCRGLNLMSLVIVYTEAGRIGPCFFSSGLWHPVSQN